MAKRLNPNLAKIHRSYLVEEIATLFSVHKNTVRRWVKKDGLPTNDDKRPMLILGSELRLFLQSKRTINKRKCKPFELYCLRCRTPQIPSENMVDYEPSSNRLGCLIGICPTCDGIINKYSSIAKLKLIKDKLDITLPKTLKHMITAQLSRQLTENGVETISAKGRKYDPNTDEVLMTVETEDPDQDGMIVEELEPGYKFKEKLLQPAKVNVAKLKL